MAADRAHSITLPPPLQSDRPGSPSTSRLRNKPVTRTATSSAGGMPINSLNRRRSSLFSESFSETHRSLRTSTDDLLLPRVKEESTSNHDNDHDPSHWHSVPLGLALLPALGGIFFQNGSAVVTDLSLLVLAAVFLNWCIRLPWNWYHAAQATRTIDRYSPPPIETIVEEYGETIGEEDEEDAAVVTSSETTPPQRRSDDKNLDCGRPQRQDILSAQKELHLHELLALASCFLGPAFGAWLLHTIRSQLSRPSEGLISNYNLTIFLLAAELAPMSHLIKMVQARTLYLQRVVRSQAPLGEDKSDSTQLLDFARRLEELEAHIADKAESENQGVSVNADMTVAKATAQASSDLRKTIQPDLDALNRAVRRYEKRTTISALQTESRLQELESRLKDVVVLAAAAQRNADNQPRNFALILLNWICALIVIPVQYGMYFLSLPSKAAQSIQVLLTQYIGLSKPKATRESRTSKFAGSVRSSRERKQKAGGP